MAPLPRGLEAELIDLIDLPAAADEPLVGGECEEGLMFVGHGAGSLR